MAAKLFSKETRTRAFLRWVKKRGIVNLRLVTPGTRAMPDFLLIGAMKSGTTSLFAHLCCHPNVHAGIVKEPRFFDENHERGIAWYRAHFPLETELPPEHIVGEASASYIFNPFAAQRIHAVAPNMKIIAMLRNPTERAISHYYHELEKGRERLPMLEAFEAEEGRAERAMVVGDYVGDDFVHFSYKRRGIYREQLERYDACFPKEQMLILSNEEFALRPDETVTRVCRFLGIDANLLPREVRKANVGSARARARLPEGVRDYLDDYFRAHNPALFEYLGCRFTW